MVQHDHEEGRCDNQQRGNRYKYRLTFNQKNSPPIVMD
ncbi:hypothetical protein IMCC12053_1848 [Celeribacter marinus]|uniref:Uncharacterized protein n=1 Tax=Celeribacter marinus TaxID=1397108 RepID=A0A0N9ZJA1_9RHOB|nr:hypothetical protein IMCC12053_1848 [Celeribacter marinus]